ncbi:hypothetical protein O181_003906 [Austropuccinia psidii MF-1]|uniref:Reverse transcriptase domain-containing protein n=1 Tax=Austropuccinia psidii MF-1 TaxID=1389203 RepID=A0A9Q3BEI2_9BASI|nr:hypothetical protein [Austropuccinia psidii MF-1]
MCKTKPYRGKGYTAGESCITSFLINDVEAKVNLDTGESCTCIGKDYPEVILPEWKNNLLPIEGVQFSSARKNIYPLGILDTNIVFTHPPGSVRMNTEIVVMDNCTFQHIILGNDYLNIYGINLNNHKDRYFTIEENKRQKFSFSNIPKQMSIVSSNKDTYKEEFVTDQLVEVQINTALSPRMRKEIYHSFYTYKDAFSSDNESLGAIKGHEVDITLNIDRPYPPVLKRPAYPASLRAREAAKYTTSMDALKGFHQNFLTPKAKKLLRIITHCGIYEYLRMPFGIKNSPSHYQIMMNAIFPTELSEGWLIIHIDNIIICSDSWSLHLARLERVLDKVSGVNMKISLKKFNFFFEERKALGHIFSGLSLGIDKNEVEAVLLKPIPQNKKEVMSFLSFSSY